jgi:hypothetical protein
MWHSTADGTLDGSYVVYHMFPLSYNGYYLSADVFSLYDPVVFNLTNGMFNTDANGRDATIFSLLRGRQFTPTGFSLGLNNGDPLAHKAQ